MAAANDILWTSGEAAQATGGHVTSDWAARRVSIDSRTAQPGDLFVALKGPHFDGHDFIAGALKGGACAAVVHRMPENLAGDAPLLLVNDSMAALEALGAAARAGTKAKFVAVTGSVGKTSTKEALRLALSTAGSTYATTGNLNNQWGVPLSLANMPRSTRFGVFELGMNHAGEIGPLSRQVRPDIAIITTVAPAHLEFFPSVEAIADAKAEIFEGMAKGGIAILNRDDGHFDRLSGHARRQGISRIIGFGRHEDAVARLLDYAADGEGGRISARILGREINYAVGAAGMHQAINSLAVLAAVMSLNVDVDVAAAALAQMQALKGRGQRSKVALANGSFEIIDESYNASPAAMRAAIQVLALTKPARGARRIAVLGDMRELGPEGATLHADLAADLSAAGVDLVFTAGPLMASLNAALPATLRGAHFNDSAALTPAVLEAVRAGDIVLVKGSLGSRMGPIVEALKGLDRGGATRAVNGR
ncbi:MAG TPA: UDP-N-acetylmuramoylalanyl-D-glutamyl-2,6-diaminopimelate--D-alanyl-D-alanine ligase [Dongiaceae bacterium]|jgi:UDP-N-acetylmuramoyl-tripeptide--D-alanyl-D-alanine ligase